MNTQAVLLEDNRLSAANRVARSPMTPSSLTMREMIPSTSWWTSRVEVEVEKLVRKSLEGITESRMMGGMQPISRKAGDNEGKRIARVPAKNL